MAGVVWGGLVPHPPLIIPGIGDDAVMQVNNTVTSMKAIAEEIRALQLDTLIIISPHSPIFQDGIPIWDTAEMHGNFIQFGYPGIEYSVTVDRSMVDSIRSEAKKTKVPVVSLDDKMVERTGIRKTLDHGVMVPLHYLQEAGIHLPTVLVSIGWLSNEDLFRFGKAIQRAAADSGKKTAVLASGDLSHSLQENAPAGYNPAGEEFDLLLQEYFTTGQLDQVLQMNHQLVDQAAECGYRPILILLGALSGLSVKPFVHSYEGPFGVGYMVVSFPVEGGTQMTAQGKGEQRLDSEAKQHGFVQWAQESLETYIKEGMRKPLPDPLPEDMQERAGVFVSIKKNGLLRGCIGTIFPNCSNLAQEIRENAISAGTKDPRFYPVTEEELPYLKFSVDVLSEPESIRDLNQLDPDKYGVIVRQGNCVGLLLPHLEGIHSVADQLRIACQKAGIDPDSKYVIERFQVIRYE